MGLGFDIYHHKHHSGAHRWRVTLALTACLLSLLFLLFGCSKEISVVNPATTYELGTNRPTIPQSDPTSRNYTQPQPFVGDGSNYNRYGTEIIGEAATGDPSIVVRNGSMVDGAATAVAQELQTDGYAVDIAAKQFPGSFDGNTWILYQNRDGLKEKAQDIQSILGCGQLMVLGPDGFNADYFKEDITIVVNIDWVNANMLEEGQGPYVWTPLEIPSSTE